MWAGVLIRLARVLQIELDHQGRSTDQLLGRLRKTYCCSHPRSLYLNSSLDFTVSQLVATRNPVAGADGSDEGGSLILLRCLNLLCLRARSNGTDKRKDCQGHQESH
jgi:hypothetical protein